MLNMEFTGQILKQQDGFNREYAVLQNLLYTPFSFSNKPAFPFAVLAHGKLLPGLYLIG